jgi:hypothetical protein
MCLCFEDLTIVPDLQVSAGYWPPEPKLTLFSTAIGIGPTSRNTRNRIQMRIMNTGATDLNIKEMKITTEQDSRSWLSNIRALITGRSSSPFAVMHSCASVAPSRDCTFAVEFTSPSSGETQAKLTIISNDPGTPVLTVPIHAAVL